MFFQIRSLYILLYIAFLLIISGTVYFLSYRTGLQTLEKTGIVRIEQSRDRLLGQLASFKQLSNILAKHPSIKSIINDTVPKDITHQFLINMALITGVDRIIILDSTGRIITSSDDLDHRGISYANSPHVQAAKNGRLGFSHSIDDRKNRIFMFSRGIVMNKKMAGIVVLEVDIGAIEFEWHIDDVVIAFFDKKNFSIVANRPELTLHPLGDTDKILTNPFFKFIRKEFFGYNIWQFPTADTLPKKSLVLKRDVPQIDMTVRVFLDIESVKSFAVLQSLFAMLLLTLVGLGLLLLFQRRQRLADLLMIKELANASLELRMKNRTKELHNTQHQLIEAGKLTALGQMSAGISHELNQPLAAMKNFTENGKKLIALNRNEQACDNFERINQQIDRISKIIRSLRSFARKEKITNKSIDVQLVVSESLILSKQRIKIENIIIIQSGETAPVFIMGGHIRLQQVVINMLANAMDALVDQTRKEIHLNLSTIGNKVVFTIRDTGSGFADTSRIFEPFYSTKDPGSSNGLGLGLSISYGIIGSFGGNITCRNHPDGGAELTIHLNLAKDMT